MKRITAIVLLMVLSMQLGACSQNKSIGSGDTDSRNTTQEALVKGETRYQLVEKVYDNRESGYVNTYRYEYDQQGKLLSVWMDGCLYGETGLEKASTYEEYNYGRDGILESIVYYSNGVEVEKEIIQCDESGNIISREDTDGNIQTYKYDANNRVIETSMNDLHTVWLSYDIDGHLIEEYVPGGWKIQYEYDETGRLKSVLRDYYQSGYKEYGKADPTYSGNMESIIWYDEQQMKIARTSSAYDNSGNLIEEAVYIVDYNTEELVSQTTYKYIAIED